MKWLTVAVRLVGILTIGLILTSSPVMAADNEDTVQVVAVPNVGAGITSFTATVISDTQVDLEWTYDVDVDEVMVRAQYSEMPMSRTEGYLVYQGSGLSASDTSMNFDETGAILYYRIWAHHSDGYWLDSEVNTAETEGFSMLFLALIVACLGLTIGGYTLHRGSLAFIGMAFWLITGVYALIEASGDWTSLYGAITWVCVAGVFATAIEGALLNRGAEQVEDKLDYQDEWDRHFEDIEERIQERRARRRAR